MLKRLLRRMREVVFWGLSAGLPLNAWIQSLSEDGLNSLQSPGVGMLSLPAGLVGQADLLAGWEVFDGLRAEESLESRPGTELEREASTSTEVDQPGQPFPVHLYGQVLEGSSMMYCFLDTRSRRWFRLSPGEVDGPSGTRLHVGPGEEAVVVDLSSGMQYRLTEGRRLLVPIPYSRAGNEED